ncbi:MAG: peptidoglycan-binding protein [Clostridia bacterium]
MKRLTALFLCMALLCSVPVGAGATEKSSYKPLQYGDSGEAVNAVQQRLAELGYYTGKVSGNFLDGTRAAVKRFQKDYGLESTGEVDGETEALLVSAEYRVLSYGSDGDEVSRVQEHLATLGYYKDKVTGKYREATQGAVKDFQQQNDLNPSGEADVETQRLLFSANAEKKGASPTATPEPGADMGDINDVVMVEDGQSTVDSAADSVYGKKLSRGAKGEEVKQVQTRLKELGFFDGPVSGNYMNKTVAAVKAFQLHNGMRDNGTTDEDTWNMLFNSTDVLNSEASPRPTPVPTPVPYAITVDVRNQVTTVYGRDDNGEFTIPVRRMICSTGMKATPSDVGDWVLNGRRARWAYFGKWGSHAQYWTRINPNIAFHSVIYNAVDYMALSIKSYNKLGQRASHGCIRLLVSDARWLYENIDEGVVVSIREDLPEDQELAKSLAPPPLNKSNMLPSSTPEPTPQPNYISGAMPPQPFRQLKKGSEGEDVYWLQQKLTELGYYAGTVTGGYYDGTALAVKAYQKENGLRADGVAGVNTLQKLYEQELTQDAAPPAREATETPTAAPTATAKPTETAAPTAKPTLDAA